MAINKLPDGVKRWEANWTTADGKRTRKRFATKREAEGLFIRLFARSVVTRRVI